MTKIYLELKIIKLDKIAVRLNKKMDFINTLDKFLYSVRKQQSAATEKNYRHYLKTFSSWSKISSTENITLETIEGFKNYLKNKRNNRGELIKKNTINYYLIALRSFIKFINRQELSQFNPKQIKLFKTPTGNKKIPTINCIERLLEAPIKTKNQNLLQKRDKAVLELLFSTGLKVKEISLLKKSDISKRSNKIKISTKINSQPMEKIIEISNQAKYWINQYLVKRCDNNPFLFIRLDAAKNRKTKTKTEKNFHLTPRSIQRIVKRYARTAGLTEKITPESIRQAYTNHLIGQGIPIKRYKN